MAILIGFVPFRCMHCQNRVWRIAPFAKLPKKRRKGGIEDPVAPSSPTPAEGITLPAVEGPVANEERRG